MYKLMLCVRYLQTRYLAFVCIVSVMLGVATLIVVNAVMSGFSTKLKGNLHGVHSDLLISTERADGFDILRTSSRALTPDELAFFQHDARWARFFTDDRFDEFEANRYQTEEALVREIVSARKRTILIERYLTPAGIINEIMSSSIGEKVEVICPTIETFAILQYRDHDIVVSKPVRLIGIEPESRARVGGFAEFLVRQRGAAKPSFDLSPDALQRYEWNRKQWERANGNVVQELPPPPLVQDPNAIPEPNPEFMAVDTPKLYGVIIGHALAHVRYRDSTGQTIEECKLKEGDDVIITTAGGQELKPVWGAFIVTDYIKTEMSDYDQSLVYVPLDQLQRIRGMNGRVTELQLKLKNYDKDKQLVSDELRKLYPYRDIRIATWEQNQGPILEAIEVESRILNLLLFMIVGVAGFSILAIFTMIVSEKYRDIGIMKSLGASSWGVMQIFLGYGLLLGTVGCVLGTLLGLFITANINEIEAVLSRVAGVDVFPRDVYYFKEIPTNVNVITVALIDLGAIAIATGFSLLPAWRAANLHPVRALRFE